MLESVVLICGHCQGLLLHLRITFDPSQWWTLISVALSLAAGDIETMVFVAGSIAQHVESGSVIPLMVFTERRLPQFPNVPTVVEALGEPGLVRYGWLGFATRSGGSREVLKAVEGWTRTCLESKEFETALRNALFTPRFISSEEFAETVRKDIEFWRTWITRLRISND
jgi:tripartite-type tricarboxylate transporter receptor subunit TctC